MPGQISTQASKTALICGDIPLVPSKVGREKVHGVEVRMDTRGAEQDMQVGRIFPSY